MTKEQKKREFTINFYSDVLTLLNESGLPYLVGGTYALREHTGIQRETKDIDLFCKTGDYPKIVKLFIDHGFETEITDARWIAKVFKNDKFIDFLFNSPNGLTPVDDAWFEYSTTGVVHGVETRFVPPEEMIWSKIYLQDRMRFDGPDVNHIILRKGESLDWKRLFHRLDHHWELLLAQILNFRFVYPSQTDVIPQWLMEELLSRLQAQLVLPSSKDKVCRGPLLDHTQYNVDITDWDFKIITTNNL